jgi:hypothetical protein
LKDVWLYVALISTVPNVRYGSFDSRKYVGFVWDLEGVFSVPRL